MLRPRRVRSAAPSALVSGLSSGTVRTSARTHRQSSGATAAPVSATGKVAVEPRHRTMPTSANACSTLGVGVGAHEVRVLQLVSTVQDGVQART
ncbi:hypothetical protein DS843_16575 [Roseomonas genomospecies 6]|uniref:Uncharacterized protein n=2 Tax=Alphaproteobacteria TaxID=28211 RepID=A0A9W7TYG1_9PROT|nr:hypothetical protein DS843_16575 [Roseomonas genomospecies 6]KAA0686227.1 hypothetical protein DS837_11055 [Azospirillum brasilense]